MRARLALHITDIEVEHREILLKNKPPQMLEASPKGTVPVLILANGEIIDESLDVALWALNKSDNHELLWNLDSTIDKAQLVLIKQNDDEFKHWLDRYKYQVGYPEYPAEYYREKAEDFLHVLDQRLSHQKNLFDNKPSLADIAIFPFIRQFAFVDKGWFDQSAYSNIQRWLSDWLNSDEFEAIMTKHREWITDRTS